MVRRPLKNRRPIGPFLDTSATDNSESGVDHQQNTVDSQNSSQTQNPDPTFNSLDDLPDSPMLKQYVRREAEYLGVDESEIINSDPVETYMKRLGVWELATQER